MKHFYYLAFILLLAACYTPSQVYRLEPAEKERTFVEQGKPFAYKGIDSVIVSVGFDTHLDNEYILDVTIDNQSSDSISFNPSDVYLFRYSSDTSLAVQKLYFAVNPEIRIDSIQKSVVKEEKRAQRNAIFSILIAAAYLTTEVVAATSDNISYETMEAVRATHTVTQMVLDESRIEAADNINYLYFSKDYWHCNALRKSQIMPKTFYSGKLHFKVPYSPLYKIYIPVNNHTYRFDFKGISEIQ
jgi:hypothetical protein